MKTNTTELRKNISKYAKMVVETDEPLHVTSIHGDFYIVSRQQFESHKAYQMLTNEMCESKVQALIQAVLKGKGE